MNNYFPGSAWSATNAKKALPILVNFAQSDRKTTYTDLAWLMFRDRNYAQPVKDALGRLGKALQLLDKAESKRLGTIPPIQLLVCSKKTGRPGDTALDFLHFSKSDIARMKSRQKDTIIWAAHKKIFEYEMWPHVLQAFGLRPVTLKLPASKDILPKISDIERRPTGEGEEHKRLKLFLAENPRKIGIQRAGKGDTEVLLLSGDRLDLSFRSNEKWVAVEVKGKNSPEADLVRGIFQCLKYKIIMTAQLRYDALTGGENTQLAVPTAILACGCAVPIELREFAESLEIQIKSDLVVPEEFAPAKEVFAVGV